jgi:hypothetical protein
VFVFGLVFNNIDIWAWVCYSNDTNVFVLVLFDCDTEQSLLCVGPIDGEC